MTRHAWDIPEPGYPAPWDEPDQTDRPHQCDWGCGRDVEDLGQVCDQCIVDNANNCGDWDDESLAAKKRLNK